MASLDRVTAALEALAPLRFAEPWDNVGLLLEPAEPREVTRALLCIDLTEDVLDEALGAAAELVIAYHPPWFEPLRRLGRGAPRQRLLLRCLTRGLAVYSPHTALDAAADGVNDWLAAQVGPGATAPLTVRSELAPGSGCKLVVFTPEAAADRLREALAAEGAGVIGAYTHCSFATHGTGTFLGGEGSSPTLGERGTLERVPELRLELVAPLAALPRLAAALRRVHPYEEPAWDLVPLLPEPLAGVGPGRRLVLDTPAPLAELLPRLKAGLGVGHVQVAATRAHDQGAPLRTVAVCAGAGGALLEGVHDADLLVTGEMRHHDVLAHVARGSSVVLAGHSNTERGYLPRFAERLRSALPELSVLVSARDRDPLSLR